MTGKTFTRDGLWKKWKIFALEYDGEMPGDYYNGASVMLDWLLTELGVKMQSDSHQPKITGR